MTVNPSRKHLVLLGAGRAHLQVLKSLARQGTGDMNVTLVAPHPYYIESAMLPGYVAGDYVLEDLRIALDGLVKQIIEAFDHEIGRLEVADHIIGAHDPVDV